MSKKLLLADDSLTIQKVVGIVFANLDYQLLTADNGDAALDLARKEFPDLVIADIGMPGKDGLELCREMKSDSALSSIPVLLLPGAFENFDEGKALEAGASGWITKPFESQSLIDKVAEVLAAAPQKGSAPTPVAEPESVFEPEPDSQAGVAIEPQPAVEEDGISFEEPEAEEEIATDDDIWDAVTFEEEDLQGEPAELPAAGQTPEPAFGGDAIQFEDPAPAVEEVPAVIEDPAPAVEDFSFVDDAPSGVTEEPSGEIAEPVEEILDLGEDDILELDEDAIVEEVEEEAGFEEIAEEDALDEVVEEDALDEVAEEAIVEEVEEEPFDFSAGGDTAPIATFDAPAATSVDFSAPEPVEAEAVEENEAEPVPAASFESASEIAPAAAPGPVAVEEQLRRLDEDEMEAVIRKVATPLIEKLAAEMLEQVVWEVVPDLAESMIKDEIRKIKEGAA